MNSKKRKQKRMNTKRHKAMRDESNGVYTIEISTHHINEFLKLKFLCEHMDVDGMSVSFETSGNKKSGAIRPF